MARPDVEIGVPPVASPVAFVAGIVEEVVRQPKMVKGSVLSVCGRDRRNDPGERLAAVGDDDLFARPGPGQELGELDAGLGNLAGVARHGRPVLSFLLSLLMPIRSSSSRSPGRDVAWPPGART